MSCKKQSMLRCDDDDNDDKKILKCQSVGRLAG